MRMFQFYLSGKPSSIQPAFHLWVSGGSVPGVFKLNTAAETTSFIAKIPPSSAWRIFRVSVNVDTSSVERVHIHILLKRKRLSVKAPFNQRASHILTASKKADQPDNKMFDPINFYLKLSCLSDSLYLSLCRGLCFPAGAERKKKSDV